MYSTANRRLVQCEIEATQNTQMVFLNAEDSSTADDFVVRAGTLLHHSKVHTIRTTASGGSDVRVMYISLDNSFIINRLKAP